MDALTEAPKLDEGVDAFGLAEGTLPKSNLNQEQATRSAARIHFATNKDSPGTEVLLERLLTMSTDQVKEGLALTYQNNENMRRQGRVAESIQNARNNGTPLTEQDFSDILKLKGSVYDDNDGANPQTYVEKRHAERVREEAGGEEVVPDWAKKHIGITEVIRTVKDEYDQRYSGETAGTRIANALESFIPGRTWYLQHNAIKGGYASSFLTGNNKLEQIDDLYRSGSVDEANTRLRQAVEEMYAANPNQAVQFLQELLTYGESDAIMDNAYDAVDVASLVPLNITKNAIKAGVRNFTRSPVWNSTGQVARAAYDRARDDLIRVSDTFGNAAGPGSVNVGEEILSYLPTLNNPTNFVGPSTITNFSAGYTTRLLDILHNYNGRVMEQLRQGVLNVSRAPDGTAARDIALRETEQLFRDQYNHVAHGILDVENIRSVDNVLTNTDHIVVRIGDSLAKPFVSKQHAENYAKMADLKGYDIERVGRDGWALRFTKAVDETTPRVQAALRIDTQANPTPTGKIRQWLGWAVAKKENRLNEGIQQDLKAATFGMIDFQRLTQNMLEETLGALPARWRSSSRRDLLNFMEAQRSFQHPVTGEIGRFSNTLAEFERDWLNHFGRRPSEQEATAYTVLRNVNDIEWFVNNLSATKMLQSKGVENHFLMKGKERLTNPIQGTFRSEIDWSQNSDLGIAIVDSRTGNIRYVRRSDDGRGNRFIDPQVRAEIDDLLISRGHKAVQLSPTGERQFRAEFGHTGGKVHFVITNDMSSSPLSLVNIDYRPGGHHFYRDQFLVAQPVMRSATLQDGRVMNDYVEDTAIFYARTRADAMQLSDHMEQARQLRQAGRIQEATAYVNNHLPFTYNDFDTWITSGRLNGDTPITFKDAGGRTIDNIDFRRHFQNLNDNKTDAYELFGDDTYFRFNQQRETNMDSIVRAGTANNPLWQVQQARMLNPIESLSRANLNVLKGQYFDDVKIKASRQFVAEFGDLLADSIEDVQKFPIRALVDGNFRTDVTDLERLAAAKNNRRAVLEFLQVEPDLKDTNWYLETAFDYLGPRVGNMAANFIETMAERRPAEFAKKWFGFQFRMGLYNPVQLFLQASGQLTTIAIAGPRNGMLAYGAKHLMHPLVFTGRRDLVNHMAGLATRIGWDRRQFEECFDGMMRSGWHNVDDTFADLSDYVRTGQTTLGKKIGTRGLVFFNHGERANRITAWNAAYLEWRTANPVGAMDDDVLKRIMNRADLFTLNMTRASAAAFQQGWTAFPTQFMSYQMRTMELLAGQEIDRAAKLRLLGMNSAMYGIPTGVAGAAFGVYPWQQELKQELEERGYQIDEGGWKAFLDGLPAFALKAAGYDLDIAGRYGPQGWSLLKDIMDDTSPGHKTTLQLLAGPAAKNVWSFAEPALYLMTRPLREAEAKPKLEYLQEMASVFSTYTQTTRAIIAMNSGTLLAKNGVDPILKGYDDPVFGVAMGIFGVSPDELSRFYRSLETKEEIRKAQEAATNEGIKYYRKGLDPDLSPEERKRYMDMTEMVWSAGKLTFEQRRRALNKALQGHQSSMERIDEDMKSWNLDQMQRFFNDVEENN